MTNEQQKQRIEMLQSFVNYYKQYVSINDIKGKAAKQVLHTLCAYEHTRTQDPVFAISAMRLDINDLQSIINKLQTNAHESE